MNALVIISLSLIAVIIFLAGVIVGALILNWTITRGIRL